MYPIIENNKLATLKLCKNNKDNTLYVFGSVLTKVFSGSSDLDFKIDLE